VNIRVRVWDNDPDVSPGSRELVDEFEYDYNVADCSIAPNIGSQLIGIHQQTV